MNVQSNQSALKGGIIGFGFIASQGHAPAYLKRAQETGDVQIVAVADICESRRQLAAQMFPGVRLYNRADLLLDKEQDIDFVDICTPPMDHAEIAHLALNAGCHVLCEKPLTTTWRQAQELLRHARDCQRVIFPCHNYKYAPVIRAVREVLDQGLLGSVRTLTLNTYRNTHAKGVPEWNTHWRRDKQYSGGGIAMDHGSHTFYLTFDWMGSYPTAITAKTELLVPGYSTEDYFTATLQFPKGIVTTTLSWTAGVRKVMYSIQGTKGALTIDDDDWQLALMQSTSGPDVAQGAVSWQVQRRSIASHWMDASHVHWFHALLTRFQTAIARQEYVGQDAKEAAMCLQIIETAYQSSQQSSRELPLFSPSHGLDC